MIISTKKEKYNVSLFVIAQTLLVFLSCGEMMEMEKIEKELEMGPVFLILFILNLKEIGITCQRCYYLVEVHKFVALICHMSCFYLLMEIQMICTLTILLFAFRKR